jgi:hypothetical protein
MHFDILVEDFSGKTAIDILISKIIDTDQHTFTSHPYKGIGRIPKDLRNTADPQKRILLDQLPRFVRGFGLTYRGYPENYPAILIIVCDLDDRCLKAFRNELLQVVGQCQPRPETYFCIAIEEGEAWYLGDLAAVKTAYPNAKDAVLNTYENDEICGTWEKLADAVYPGGSNALSQLGYPAIGREKADWATKISQHMEVEISQSTSFCYFRDKLRNLSNQ